MKKAGRGLSSQLFSFASGDSRESTDATSEAAGVAVWGLLF